jgi:tetratricopeptide (TPR) repeat protein/ADP-heptose:LPS heptosyltransferase
MAEHKKINFDPNELSQRGLKFLEDANYPEARNIFDKLIEHFPNNPDLLNLFGYVNLQLENYSDSIEAYSKSIEIIPNQVGTLFNRAIASNHLGNKKDALKDYANVNYLDPNNLDVYINRSAIYESLGDFKNALKEINFVIDRDPKNFKALMNRATIYEYMFEFDNALIDIKKALEIEINDPDIYVNAANLYKTLKKDKLAIKCFNKAIKIKNDSDLAKYNLALFLLDKKDFLEGWNLYESRFFLASKPRFIYKIPEAKIINENSKILIWAEQGLGDQIIYSSMLNDLPRSNSITVSIDKRLMNIYRRSFKFLKFINSEDLSEKLIQNFDYQLPLGSLGKFYRNDLKAFKNQPNFFLITNDTEVKKIQKQLENKSKKICGISWKSKNEKIGFAKSLRLEDMSKLLKIEDINFINLQYGDTEEEIKDLKKKHQVKIDSTDELDKFNDINSLLNYIQACDFVITSSNVTAHLAGSIGKKTFLIAPHELGKIWYWHDDTFSIWYPSIKIFRQENPNSWEMLIEKIISEIN